MSWLTFHRAAFGCSWSLSASPCPCPSVHQLSREREREAGEREIALTRRKGRERGKLLGLRERGFLAEGRGSSRGRGSSDRTLCRRGWSSM